MNLIKRLLGRAASVRPRPSRVEEMPRESWKVIRRAMREQFALGIRPVDVCLKCGGAFVAETEPRPALVCGCRVLLIPEGQK